MLQIRITICEKNIRLPLGESDPSESIDCPYYLKNGLSSEDMLVQNTQVFPNSKEVERIIICLTFINNHTNVF